MKRFLSLMCTAAIATACQAPAVETGSTAPSDEPTATGSTSADAEDPKTSDDPTNAHGLKLSKAREAIAKLTQSLTRGDVERALGDPDQTAFTNPDGTPTETEGGGLQWTYEWTLASGERTRFIIGFHAGTAGSRITHYYWLREG